MGREALWIYGESRVLDAARRVHREAAFRCGEIHFLRCGEIIFECAARIKKGKHDAVVLKFRRPLVKTTCASDARSRHKLAHFALFRKRRALPPDRQTAIRITTET